MPILSLGILVPTGVSFEVWGSFGVSNWMSCGHVDWELLVMASYGPCSWLHVDNDRLTLEGVGPIGDTRTDQTDQM